MKTFVFASAAALSFAALSLHPSEAHALGPVNVEVGAKVGLATNPVSDAPYNPLGLGLGARGGVEILDSIYVGGNLMYYFGGSQDLPGSTGSASSHALLLGVEAGYGFHLSMLTIRPQLGVGEATLSSSFSSSNGSTSLDGSTTQLYLEPGVTAFVTLGVVYIGGNVNLLVIPGVDQGNGDSKTWLSFAPGIQVGARF